MADLVNSVKGGAKQAVNDYLKNQSESLKTWQNENMPLYDPATCKPYSKEEMDAEKPWLQKAFEKVGLWSDEDTYKYGTPMKCDPIPASQIPSNIYDKAKMPISTSEQSGASMIASSVVAQKLIKYVDTSPAKIVKKIEEDVKDNVQVKKKKEKEKLKCGEGGTYYELKKKIAQAVGMERDHVPSGAALKKRALELNDGIELTGTQLRKIENVGHTLAIPKGIHMNFSLTYKSLNNKELIAKDASNLSKAAKRDMEAIKKGLDPECKKRYKKYADKIKKLKNSDYDKMLSDALKGK